MSMNYCKWILAGLLATLASLGSATTYTYTGTPYTGVSGSGSFTTAMSVTGWFTTASPLPPSMPATTIGPTGTSPLVTGWSFSDGLSTYTSANSEEIYSPSSFTIATDASGNISTFTVGFMSPLRPHTVGQSMNAFGVGGLSGSYFNLVCGAVSAGVCTALSPQPGYSAAASTFGAGTWVMTHAAAVPVPATSNALLVLMALALGWLAFRQQRSRFL